MSHIRNQSYITLKINFKTNFSTCMFVAIDSFECIKISLDIKILPPVNCWLFYLYIWPCIVCSDAVVTLALRIFCCYFGWTNVVVDVLVMPIAENYLTQKIFYPFSINSFSLSCTIVITKRKYKNAKTRLWNTNEIFLMSLLILPYCTWRLINSTAAAGLANQRLAEQCFS